MICAWVYKEGCRCTSGVSGPRPLGVFFVMRRRWALGSAPCQFSFERKKKNVSNVNYAACRRRRRGCEVSHFHTSAGRGGLIMPSVSADSCSELCYRVVAAKRCKSTTRCNRQGKKTSSGVSYVYVHVSWWERTYNEPITGNRGAILHFVGGPISTKRLQ